jgi:hypothetical protein
MKATRVSQNVNKFTIPLVRKRVLDLATRQEEQPIRTMTLQLAGNFNKPNIYTDVYSRKIQCSGLSIRKERLLPWKLTLLPSRHCLTSLAVHTKCR